MFRGNDILKIYDTSLNHIGCATREQVHTEGLLHQVAHVWMFQLTAECDNPFILFQKRSMKREIYPGKYDLLQTTHFDPEESYEEAIVKSMDVYLGSRISKQDIIHIGSTHQKIDVGNYHDNALVQVFVLNVTKALFIMPDTEEIIKVRYKDFDQMVHGITDHITLYSLDDVKLRECSANEWWIRQNEYEEVIAPYLMSKKGYHSV